MANVVFYINLWVKPPAKHRHLQAEDSKHQWWEWKMRRIANVTQRNEIRSLCESIVLCKHRRKNNKDNNDQKERSGVRKVVSSNQCISKWHVAYKEASIIIENEPLHIWNMKLDLQSITFVHLFRGAWRARVRFIALRWLQYFNACSVSNW